MRSVPSSMGADASTPHRHTSCNASGCSETAAPAGRSGLSTWSDMRQLQVCQFAASLLLGIVIFAPQASLLLLVEYVAKVLVSRWLLWERVGTARALAHDQWCKCIGGLRFCRACGQHLLQIEALGICPPGLGLTQSGGEGAHGPSGSTSHSRIMCEGDPSRILNALIRSLNTLNQKPVLLICERLCSGRPEGQLLLIH